MLLKDAGEQVASSPVTTAIITIATIIGASGLAALLKVWLENKRLLNKSYRRTMAERIDELEDKLEYQYQVVGTLRAENAELRTELKILRHHLGHDEP